MAYFDEKRDRFKKKTAKKVKAQRHGSYEQQDAALERALGNCLKACSNLAELRFTWECTRGATNGKPEMYQRLAIVKDERKAALSEKEV